MKQETYNMIISTIKTYRGSYICPWRNIEEILHNRFPDVPEATLWSIYSQEYQKKMKYSHPKCIRMADKLYARYCKVASSENEPGVLLRLAESIDTSPMLLARIILEQHQEKCTADDGSPESCSKATITKMMKDTTLIKDKDLAFEIYLCLIHDDQYGSVTDCVNHSIGQEYERKLQRQAKRAGLTFRDEEHLRKNGYDKTPDVKLEIPAAVDGFIINWIESKALFGDEESHRNYTKNQYLSYWNRFGAGLVIYWFGFVDSVQDPGETKFMVRDSFPEDITLMKPDSFDAGQ